MGAVQRWFLTKGNRPCFIRCFSSFRSKCRYRFIRLSGIPDFDHSYETMHNRGFQFSRCCSRESETSNVPSLPAVTISGGPIADPYPPTPSIAFIKDSCAFVENVGLPSLSMSLCERSTIEIRAVVRGTFSRRFEGSSPNFQPSVKISRCKLS